MRTEAEIRKAIRLLEEEAEWIKKTDGTKVKAPDTHCGRAIYGDRIDALDWVLGKQDTIAGIKID